MPRHRLGQHFLRSKESNPEARRRATERRLLNAESALGRTIFGPLKADEQREFFYLKKNVWLWFNNGLTVRYEVRKNGVFKKVASGSYEKITGSELGNFREATKAYLVLIKTRLYN